MSPRLTHVSLSGLALGKPRVGLRLTSGPRALPINSFAVGAAVGPAFRPQPEDRPRRREGRASGSYILALRHGTLSFTLHKPSRSVAVTILPRALVEDKSLVKRIAAVRNQPHPRPRRQALAEARPVVSLTDTARMVSPSTVAVVRPLAAAAALAGEIACITSHWSVLGTFVGRLPRGT